MSYRTYINDFQIFGNHEYYPEWIEFIKSQGIEVNEEGEYEGDIKDFMAALDVVETIVMRMEEERRKNRAELEERLAKKPDLSEEGKEMFRKRSYGVTSVFDWSNTYDVLVREDKNDRFRDSLFDRLHEIIENGYAFLPYTLYKACEDKLERIDPWSKNGYFHCYKIKDGETIHVFAR